MQPQHVTVGDEPKQIEESPRSVRTLVEMNAALGERSIFHYELRPRVKEVAIGENTTDKMVVVDYDRPAVLMLVSNDVHSCPPTTLRVL